MLAFRETEIHYSNWLYPQKQERLFFIVIISLILHISCFLLLSFLNPEKLVSLKETKGSFATKPPISIHFENAPPRSSLDNDLSHKKSGETNIPKNNAGGILTDKNQSSKSKTLVPKELRAPHIESQKNPFISKRFPNERKKDAPVAIPPRPQKNKDIGMDSFLPQSSSAYIDQLRKNAPNPQLIEGDGGDIPISGDDLAPREGPKIIERYAVKDMSLYQFSQEFKEKFGGVWNSQERWVPPSSPLRPGDIVYYKLYIKGDGTLQKFENLSSRTAPLKDFSALDKIITSVLSRVFPMTVPQRFAHNLVTEIVAIQVIGTNSPVQYSFE